MQSDELKRRISAGRGDALADLVLRNARIVNVFTDEIDTADIAISGNSIVGVGTYHGRKEVDLHGKYVCPGLIDGHIHIESSMLCGPAFEQAVLPHGTTAVVTDPHEISNVAGWKAWILCWKRQKIWPFRFISCCPPVFRPRIWMNPVRC